MIFSKCPFQIQHDSAFFDVRRCCSVCKCSISILSCFCENIFLKRPLSPLSPRTRQTFAAASSVCADMRNALAWTVRSDGGAETLADVIRCHTVYGDVSFTQATKHVHQLLQTRFPRLHNELEWRTINELSLLYRWPAEKNHNEKCEKPMLLYAHTDVVPVEDQKHWKVPPFEGRIDCEKRIVHGRGAIDDKNMVCAMLSAIELLIEQGVKPQRDIYVAIGCDEEVGGASGAAHIAQYLRENNIHFEAMIDEGLMHIAGALPGIPSVVLVGVVEKGWANVQALIDLDVTEIGHSSMPNQTAIARLASVAKIEKHPFTARFHDVTKQMFKAIAAEATWPFRLVFRNLWLFEPLLLFIMQRSNATAASVRSTSAITIFNGGTKANVLPQRACAIVNHRVHPCDTLEDVLQHDVNVLNCDHDIKLTMLSDALQPSEVSSTSSAIWYLMQKAAAEVFPSAPFVPGLMIGNTDSHHFKDIVDDIYRFQPITLHVDQLTMLHGANELISFDNITASTLFFMRLLRAA